MTESTYKFDQLVKISQTFTPAAPVSSASLFAGRADEIMQVISIIGTPGQHAVLYGERGVGKTSLVNVLSEVVTRHNGSSILLSVRINCTTNDNFRSIWKRAFRELELAIPEEWSYSTPEPDDIRF
ncbi:ATP-binding protein, partial [Umezawaea sp.]|uniref:ATP-binding protein n=1 Tax=Umezawaea sp. TaxID=1955258 RepID=UPI002ED1221A